MIGMFLRELRKLTTYVNITGDSIGLKPVLSEEANAACERIQNTLLFNFDYGFNFRRSIGKSGGQSVYSLTRDKLHYEKTKTVTLNHPFVKYIMELKNGELDMDVFISFFRGFNKQKPELSLYDTIDITYNGKKINTTLGRLILNRVLFGDLWNNPHFHYINEFITEGDLGNEFKYVAQLNIEKKANVDMNHIIDLYQEMCLRLSTLINASVSSKMLDPDKHFTKIRDSILDAGYKKYLETNDISDYMDAENKAIEAAKEYYKDNPMYQLYISKNRAKWDNDFKQLCIAQGATQDIVTGRINVVRTALVDGTSNTDIIGQINTGMESAGARGILTARGGALFKELADSGQTIYGIDHDCGSTKGVMINTKNKWDLINRYVIINKKSILITLDNVDQFIGKDIEVRSPYHCHEKNGNYCSHCLGRTVFELTGQTRVALGMFITEIGTGVLNMYMKAVHTAGASLHHIKDLNDYVYPKPTKSLFYIKQDPIEKVDKIYCTEDMEWRVPAAAVTKVGTTYMVLAHGSIIVGSETKDPRAFVLGTEVSTNPIEVLNPDSKLNDVDKHYILRYKKDTPIINTTATFKKEDTVYKMLYLFIKGNVSSLVPLETHKTTLMNAFNTNKRITASDISYDILLSTLARSKNDLSKPAREFDNEKEYEFVSLTDITMMGGTFSACFGPDGSRGRFVMGSKTEYEQNLKHSPYEESMRM